MDDMLDARMRLADQLRRRGIADLRVLDAMARVPRELFVDPSLRDFAYADGPLPIDGGQTISQPYVVALMAEAAALGPNARVLEVGAGSGYAAAVFGLVAGEVFAIERDEDLAQSAANRLAALGYENVSIRAGDGSRGWPEAAPFDAILVSAAAAEIPPALRAQLRIGGRLIVPVGGQWRGQELMKIVRTSETEFLEDRLALVSFVPLV